MPSAGSKGAAMPNSRIHLTRLADLPANAATARALNALYQAKVAYRLRWRRKYFLWRAQRKSNSLQPVAQRTHRITDDMILGAMVLRNEFQRLPSVLQHYRALGVQHFLIVDNGSTDGSLELLRAQTDVSLWQTAASYRFSRFGMDWINALLRRYGHGHWCLTFDADELFVYPHWHSRPLSALTDWLERGKTNMFGALMLELYPTGRLGGGSPNNSFDPLKALTHFDSGNYSITYQEKLRALWVQGGPRARSFFANQPRKAPTLNKIPLVKWHRSFAYNSATHSLLPRRLNKAFNDTGGMAASGILLHTKFLPQIIEKSLEEKKRGQHFANSSLYQSYYDSLIKDPTLWTPYSTRLRSWRQLQHLGLMSAGGWG